MMRDFGRVGCDDRIRCLSGLSVSAIVMAHLFIFLAGARQQRLHGLAVRSQAWGLANATASGRPK
jgi:hypothetical protein